jgi:hypothetical protein
METRKDDKEIEGLRVDVNNIHDTLKIMNEKLNVLEPIADMYKNAKVISNAALKIAKVIMSILIFLGAVGTVLIEWKRWFK